MCLCVCTYLPLGIPDKKIIHGSKKKKQKVVTMLTMKENCKYIVLLPWLQAPMFSWPRLRDADPLLRCEMSSTGEVGS